MPGSELFSEQELRRLLAGGEGQFVEFKSLWDRSGARRRVLARSAVRALVAEALAAFANSDGGILILGVDDDGTPSGHGYPDNAIVDILAVPAKRIVPALRPRTQRAVLDDAELIVVAVEPSAEAVMVEGNGFPYRVGDAVVRESQEAINERKTAYRRRGYEQRICLDASLDDLDIGLAERFFRRVAEAGRPPTEVLLRYGLIHPGGPSGARVTNAAVLMFARDSVWRWHPRADARVFRVDGTERSHGSQRNVTQIAQLDLPIAALVESLRDVVRGQVRRSESLSGLYFEDTPEYPEVAWQEALVNAIAHREYDDFGRGIEVWLYSDRMEVHSPGGLVPPVTLEALRSGVPTHASRNPMIVRVLAAAGIMRDEGEGVPRMFREMSGMGLLPPEIDADESSHVVRLRNTPAASARDVLSDGEGNDPSDWSSPSNASNLRRADRDRTTRVARLRSRVLRLGEVLDAKGHLSNADYRELFDVDRREALADLTTLVDLGHLELRGERRGAHYIRPGTGT